ncbi:MAG: efflux RND transporter periplasmic adaptor subunit [Spirochaetaceae bacterium]|jgi:multidrug efflux pump subunit AcrA (membrane-fusion protein)|nr:efflux RND transporter periplasmic adaptor subunit [Spirochaetaceae bacterium]
MKPRKKKKSKNGIKAVLIILAASLVLCALGFAANRKFGWFEFLSGAAKSDVTYTVRGEVYKNIIEIAGNIAAAKEQNLQAAGTGTVTAVFVSEGDTVSAGQIILSLDDTEQRYNLAKHDFDMQQRRITGSPRELSLMKVQRDVLVQRIKDRQIIANFDGVIAEFTAAAGDVFEAKDTVGVIIDRSYLAATVEVVESDAPKLKSGQKVTLKFPAAPQETFEGIVNSFPAVAVKSSRGASVVKAEIRLDNPPEIILPNYSFTGEIEISAPETFILVERDAIKFEEDKAGGRRAYAEKILPDGSIERVDVQVVPYGMEFVKIIRGLSEGDALKAQQQPRTSGKQAAGRGIEFRQGGQGRQGGGRNQGGQPMMILR